MIPIQTQALANPDHDSVLAVYYSDMFTGSISSDSKIRVYSRLSKFSHPELMNEVNELGKWRDTGGSFN